MKDKTPLLRTAFLFLMLSSLHVYAQQRQISGKVQQASDGKAIMDASVIVEGQNTGTKTDRDGLFKIDVPAGATLLISSVGFEPQRISTGDRNFLQVSLQVVSRQLNEIVAIGYSAKARNEISSSVAIIKQEQLQTNTSHDLNTMLQGKVAGLQVLSNNQTVDGTPDIRIRGTGSLSAGSTPLYVVDGVIGGFYNPNDVESVTVLKDAGATGLYGSRAANGVIVITTKKGRNGTKNFSFDSKVGVSIPNMGNVKYYSSQDLYPLIREGFLNAGRTDADFLAAFPDSVRNVNFNWMKWYYHPALNQTYNASYSAGNDNTTIYLSGNYYQEKGMLRQTAFKRYSGTMSLTHKINQKLNIALGFYGEYFQSNLTQMQTDPVTPFDRPYHDDGTIFNEQEVKSYWYQVEKKNPAAILESGSFNRNYTTRINPHFKLNYKITDGLNFSATSRLNLSNLDNREYQGLASTLTYSATGAVTNGNDKSVDLLNNAILSGNKRLGNHSFDGLLGVENNKINRQFFAATGIGLLPGSDVLSATSQPKTVSGSQIITTYQSYFSQLNYNYLQKFFFTGSYRVDGSSRFGANHRYGQFYSVAGSWLISKEEFMRRYKFIDNLRLRASYGLTGNSNIDDYAHLKTYSRVASYDGSSAATPLIKGNPDLTWEIAKTFDAGFNLDLYKRVEIVFDYYYNKNDDLLYDVPLDGSTGYDKQFQNIGRLDKWGYDLSVVADVVKTKTFTWNANLQLGYNQDRVRSLPHPLINDQILEVNGPHYMWYIYDWAGVDPSNGMPMWYTRDVNGKVTGTTEKYNEASRVRAGKASPDYMGGFTNTLDFKNFEVGVLLTYAFGHYYTLPFLEYDHDGSASLKSLLDMGETRWHKPGDIAEAPKFIWNNTTHSNQISTRFLEKADFLKVASVSIGYHFPTRLVSRMNVKGLNVFLRGENLKIYNQTHLYSPEYTGFNGLGGGRYDKPFSTKFILGVNINL